MTILAIFDLDKTLIANDSDYNWGVFLGRHGYVNADEYQQQNELFYQQYAQGTLDIIEYSEFVFKVLSEHPMSELLEWRAQFLEEMILPLVEPQAKALVQKHVDMGHTCVLVSATNEFVIEPIAQLFGFKHIIGTTPEQIDGQFTGKVVGTPSFQAGKIKRMEQWLAAHNLSWDSVKGSFFYSDSINDLPLLEYASYPVACNPDASLREIALSRHWPILELFARA